jgi:hypothetical protein
MNYWVSAGAMQVALQTNVPWVGPAKAFENIKAWEDANVKRYAYLPYNHKDDQDDPIPAPTRPAPPVWPRPTSPASRSRPSSSRTSPASTKTRRARQAMRFPALPSTPARSRARRRPITSPTRSRWAWRIPGGSFWTRPRGLRHAAADPHLQRGYVQSDVQVDPSAMQAHQEVEKPDEENATEVVWNPKLGRTTWKPRPDLTTPPSANGP